MGISPVLLADSNLGIPDFESGFDSCFQQTGFKTKSLTRHLNQKSGPITGSSPPKKDCPTDDSRKLPKENRHWKGISRFLKTSGKTTPGTGTQPDLRQRIIPKPHFFRFHLFLGSNPPQIPARARKGLRISNRTKMKRKS